MVVVVDGRIVVGAGLVEKIVPVIVVFEDGITVVVFKTVEGDEGEIAIGD
jgi:hypothetical protein